MAVNTWDIAPNYDEWGKDTYWSCADWLEWHKRLKKQFGADKAKYIWEYAFAKGTSFASHWDCRTTNAEFRQYCRDNNLSMYGSVAEIPAMSIVLNTLGGAYEFLDNVGDLIGDVAKGVGNTGKILRIAIPLVAATALGYFAYRGYVKIQNLKKQ